MTDRTLDAELRRLAEALALGERDRQLLGYEIHDSVVQSLTAAAMLLEGAGKSATFVSTESQENFSGGLRLLREGIAEFRRLISGMAGVEVSDRGLVASLRLLVEKFRTDQALAIDFACELDEPRLPSSAQHLLLRIAQEALFNVLKHAKASSVEMRLWKDGQTLNLSIADDGVGFDPARVPSGNFGLEGMRERARILGGILQIDSSSGRGTQVTIQFQIPPPSP